MAAQAINQVPIQQSSTSKLGTSMRLSAKSREKLEQLSKWRIDSSAIQFRKDGPGFHGGFASVCRASLLDVQKDGSICDPQDIAVKKMKIDAFEEREKVLGLALREARYLAELSHNNIVRLRGFVEDIASGRVWLVFPWANNGNLSDFIALVEWEVPERIQLVYDVIGGLEHLHTRDPPIYHGDLKSVNILVNSKRQAVLTDFGSARRIRPKETESDEPSTSDARGVVREMVVSATVDELANTMTLTGNQYTLRWAAPELLMNDEAGTKADIWSFGWVCYEVMTGCIPFSDIVKSTAVTLRICKGDLPFLDDHVRMSLIRSLGSIMSSCWSADPGKRPSATNCRKSIRWLPRCTPRSPQTLGSRMPEATLSLWLGHMYRLQSNYKKASDAFTEVLKTATKDEDSTMQAEALIGVAEIHRRRGEFTKAVPLYQELLRIHEEAGNRKGKAAALFGLVEINRYRNEYTGTLLLYEECLRFREETDDPNKKAGALIVLAETHRRRNEYAKAIALYEECLRIREETGNLRGKASALRKLAGIHRRQKEYTKAASLYYECLIIHEETGDRDAKAAVLRGLADIHRARSEFTTAVSLYDECLSIHEETGNRKGKADALQELGDIHRERSEYTKAVPLYEECLRLHKETADLNENSYAYALWGLAETHRLQKEYTKPVPLYEECLRIYEETGNRNGKAEALWGLATIHQYRKEYTKTISLYEECLHIYNETGNRNGRAAALWGLATIHRRRNEHTKAFPLYEECRHISEDTGNRKGKASALRRLADIHRSRKEYPKAVSLYNESIQIGQEIGCKKLIEDSMSGLAAISSTREEAQRCDRDGPAYG